MRLSVGFNGSFVTGLGSRSDNSACAAPSFGGCQSSALRLWNGVSVTEKLGGAFWPPGATDGAKLATVPNTGENRTSRWSAQEHASGSARQRAPEA
jgi:hypothetical protein